MRLGPPGLLGELAPLGPRVRKVLPASLALRVLLDLLVPRALQARRGLTALLALRATRA